MLWRVRAFSSDGEPDHDDGYDGSGRSDDSSGSPGDSRAMNEVAARDSSDADDRADREDQGAQRAGEVDHLGESVPAGRAAGEVLLDLCCLAGREGSAGVSGKTLAGEAAAFVRRPLGACLEEAFAQSRPCP